jgi:nitrate reductase cytochrome c-type subunit
MHVNEREATPSYQDAEVDPESVHVFRVSHLTNRCRICHRKAGSDYHATIDEMKARFMDEVDRGYALA